MSQFGSGIFVGGNSGNSFLPSGYSSSSYDSMKDKGAFDYDIDFGQKKEKSRYSKFSDALAAANKYKSETDYKAEKESKEKSNRAAQRNTLKLDDNTSVMEGYTDPGFRLEGVKGRSVLGTVGALVSPFAPITGQAIGAVGGLTGI
tara:strand:- start:149 stop:586 length:438 start_codon:yes stop_codon:yes gene_type:complete